MRDVWDPFGSAIKERWITLRDKHETQRLMAACIDRAPGGLDGRAGPGLCTEFIPVFRQEELDQILAPIALYPDSLLAQILMAATYPLEVVQADRWVKQNRNLPPEALNDALDRQNWDPSVKALVPFPDVLSMMSERLDWTQRVGDAFLAQEADVMDSIQQLRAKAYAAGNLRSTQQLAVSRQGAIIVIEPANPQVVYVPVYNPVVSLRAMVVSCIPPRGDLSLSARRRDRDRHHRLRCGHCRCIGLESWVGALGLGTPQRLCQREPDRQHQPHHDGHQYKGYPDNDLATRPRTSQGSGVSGSGYA